jgi:hypothetical protein
MSWTWRNSAGGAVYNAPFHTPAYSAILQLVACEDVHVDWRSHGGNTTLGGDMTVLMRTSAAVAAVLLTMAIASTPVLAKVKTPGAKPVRSGGSNETEPMPAPILGAGLPLFAAAYSAYWLARRSRRQTANDTAA